MDFKIKFLLCVKTKWEYGISTDIIVVVVNSIIICFLSYTQTPTIMHVLILRLYIHKIIYFSVCLYMYNNIIVELL